MPSTTQALRTATAFLRDDRGALRFAGKTPVTVVMGVETERRVREHALEAAAAAGLPDTHILSGGFVADQISWTLEHALVSQPATARQRVLSPSGGDETFVTIALSRGLARQLRREALRDARRAGIARGKHREDYVTHHMGQRLQEAYEPTQPERPSAEAVAS